MAINLLGALPKPTNNYQSLSYQGKPKPTTPAPLATSTVTGQPTAGSITMGVTAKTPAAKVNKTPNVLPTNQANPIKPVAPTTPPATSPTPNPGLLAANTPKPPTPTQPPQTFPGTVGGLLGAAYNGSPAAQNYTAQTAQYGAGNIPIGQQARDIAEQFGQKYADVGQQGAKFQAGQLTTGTTPVAEGNAAVTAQTTAAQQTALAQGQQAALQGVGYQLTGQNQAANAANAAAGQATAAHGQSIDALQAAAGLTAPVQLPYSNQYVNPQNGQPIGGGVTGGLQDAVSNVVSKLTAGQMSYSDAVSALSGYGQGGVNALQQALPPGFNIAQSNTLANQQGSIGPAYEFAKTALSNLQEAMKGLGFAQGTNIPGVNAVGNTFSNVTGVGSDATRKMAGAVAEARNAYSQLLAASQGGTPTQYGAQATAAIPDNPTPNDIAGAIQNLETLGQAKVNIYGNPGQSGTQNASTNVFSW